MSDLSSILGYLADIAGADKPPSFFVEDVVFTGVRPIDPAWVKLLEPGKTRNERGSGRPWLPSKTPRCSM